MPAYQRKLTLQQQGAIAVAVVAGAAAGAQALRAAARSARAKQRELWADAAGRAATTTAGGGGLRSSTAGGGSGGARAATTSGGGKVAVDGVFLRRLLAILRICVPSAWSWEAALVLAQGCLLVSRTLLTDYASRIEGYCGRAITGLQFASFGRALAGFALVGIPAAAVNAGLKYGQKAIELAFQQRLGLALHAAYTRNRAYYAASTLGGLTAADQRITEDVERFSASLADLYSHTLKPALDLVLFTRSLSRTMGYRGQFALYSYYLLVAWLLRLISPPLAQLAAAEAGLSGGYRAAHQRLVAAAEEVAFNDPPAGAAERLVLDRHLRRLVQYARLSSFQRFLQQIADGYFVKYLASCVALAVYAAPLYAAGSAGGGSSVSGGSGGSSSGAVPASALELQGRLTGDYIRSMRLLQGTSRAVGDLILVYKRVANLAGRTARVSELLERVGEMSAADREHRALFARNVSTAALIDLSSGAGPDGPPAPRRYASPDDRIAFNRVCLNAPDGTPLVRDLTFEVARGVSVLLMGPNGCGKSSLFRVMAGLWPLQAGEIAMPERGRVFYLSQRPYLAGGGATLRDQLLYPFPPAAAWAAAAPRERAEYARAAAAAVGGVDTGGSGAADGGSGDGAGGGSGGSGAGDGSGIGSGASLPPAEITPELDAELEAALDAVDLGYLLGRGRGFDTVQAWGDTLSGGEKQRLAVARLLFHRPAYAVLDECTSAVSADGEARLYEACVRAGITLLSIGHRPSLKRFHSLCVHFDGGVTSTGKGWWVEDLAAQEQKVAK